MRIAYCSEGRTPHDARFLRLFAAAGHIVGRVALFSPGNPADEAGLGVADLCPGLAGRPAHGSTLGRILADFGPDVVVAGPVHTVALAAAVPDVAPLVAVSWGSDLLLHAARDPSARMAAAFVLGRAARVLVDSRAGADMAAAIGGLAPDRLAVAPWGVDLERPGAAGEAGAALRAGLGLGRDDVVVFTNRAFAPLYRPETALRAFALAVGRRPEFFLYMAGNGPMAGELARLAGELGLGARMRFPGWLSPEQMAAGYVAADVYLSCSSSDGSSISLLEALAAARPVVVTDIPGNREWVTDGENGFLAPVGDCRAMADGLERLAAMGPEARRAMGQAGRAVAVSRADWRQNGQTILRAVADAANQRTTGLAT